MKGNMFRNLQKRFKHYREICVTKLNKGVLLLINKTVINTLKPVNICERIEHEKIEFVIVNIRVHYLN